jgi:hypothetical protein
MDGQGCRRAALPVHHLKAAIQYGCHTNFSQETEAAGPE